MKRAIWIFFILALYVAPTPALAASREDLLAQIERLQELIVKLTAELHEKIFNENKNFRFERNLSIGSVGSDVERLQTFLSKNTQFYPEALVTGYYGEMTNRAIGRLKAEYQITEDAFGEKTRETLNKLFQEKSTFVVSTSGFAMSAVQLNEDEEARTKRQPQESILTTDIARDIHIAINQTRTKNNLNALEWNEELARVALSHSFDQSQDNEHLTDPNLLCQYPTIRHEGFDTGFGVRDRVIHASIDFRAVGENIAMIPATKSRSYTFGFDEETPKCPTRDVLEINSPEDKEGYRASLEVLLDATRDIQKVTFIREVKYTGDEIVDLAVDGWMNSPGHRENVLYESYTHGGIGVVKVNEYYIITHNFLGR
jgi:uncharacterized protein YkwD